MLTGPSSPDCLTLFRLTGMSLLSGEDGLGRVWQEFRTDRPEGGVPTPCSTCGREITTGWTLIGSGKRVCRRHVVLGRSN